MRVGIVGDDTSDVVEALTGLAADPVVDTPENVLATSPDAVVAVGEAGLLALARCRPAAPILPVAAGAGVRSVPRESVDDALSRLVAGDWTTVCQPLLSVGGADTQRSLALMDAMAVTAEPAHISEYTLTAGGEQVARFRADGIVVATPAGTRGYARAAGAPVVQPGLDVLVAVPIAPFATSLDHWVVADDEVTVTVERNESAVDVLADDRAIGVATLDDVVSIRADGAIETIRVPEGQSPFVEPGTELEKL